MFWIDCKMHLASCDFFILSNFKPISMNIKQIFAVILSILGIGALIYTAIQALNGGNFKELIVYGILGFVFFSSGVTLMRTLRDS